MVSRWPGIELAVISRPGVTKRPEISGRIVTRQVTATRKAAREEQVYGSSALRHDFVIKPPTPPHKWL